ncbi:hypothetical protein PCYB_093580 [Plasmodium cynomolgi strain B]|uniref:Phosphatidylinositol-4-phosphate 5-kinase n=1 Tax=Plasmodium cynomolgi (strain B) TaxID=1120755 RepID=K6UK76_PLACD|nr:hypothetical protein PCYB_093580 [Plasmodium cynomolgi strain B]GAB66573.1 hypothetical protein PCYB_093580 [Plasmodium cynomolgi strain B]
MGNECSCGEVNSAKARISNGEEKKKLQDLHLCWDEDVGKNLLSEDEEMEDDNYFYRLEKKKSMNKSGEKGKYKEEEDIDKWNIFGDQLEGDYIINVKKILMYVREYEEDFFLFFKKRNATSLILLKYIILNYQKYILRIGDTGVVYIGEVSPTNEKHGLGVIITPDQCMYIGEFDNDQITGFGLYVHFSKSIYVGHWKGGKTNHYGIFTHTDGTFYKGFWSNDKQNGKGIEHVHENFFFLGNYRRGEKNGFGAFILKNESMYIGHIENNCFSKKGIYFFNRKKMYITNWEKNCIEGACEILWLDRRQFYGYHSKSNSKEGIGIYKWNDGRIYFGNWSNNKQHGYGFFIVIKHIREYEQREKAPFFFFFQQTRKVKEYFFLNLLKESFFEKGRVRGELERAIWGEAVEHYTARGRTYLAASQEAPPRDGSPNGMTPQCNHLDAYLFLRTLLCMRYYQTCCSYFDLLQKKKCNSFKFNCTFYERVKEHICSVTNSYLNRHAAQERWGGSDSPAWSALQGEANHTRGEANHTGGETNHTGEEANHTSEGAGNTSEDTDDTSESGETHRGNVEETDDTDESEETNRGNGEEIHLGDHPFGENPPQQRNHTEDKHPPFEDIERLKNYLSCLNLSHVSEGDITPHSPLFALASSNIVLKLGRWENGKLQEWIHSSHKLHGEQKGTHSDSDSGDTSEGSSLEATSSTSHLRDGHQGTSSVVKGEINVQSSFTNTNSIRKGVDPRGVPTASILHKGEDDEGDEGDEDSSHEINVRHALQGEKGSRLWQESSSMGGKKPGQRDRSTSKEDSRGVSKEDSRGVSKEDSRGVSKEDSRGVSKEDARWVGKNDAGGVSKNNARRVSKEDARWFSKNDARRANKFRPHFPSLPEKEEEEGEGIPSSVTSHNYDLPKKGFSLIWSLKRMKNSQLSANEHITFEAPQAYDDEEDGQSAARHKKKKSFFGKFLRRGKQNGRSNCTK